MKILIPISSVIIATLLFSCGMTKQDETELVSFYETNFEFAKGKRDLFRMTIEKAKAENSYTIPKRAYTKVLKLDSMFNDIVKDIDSDLKSDNFERTTALFNEYTKFIDEIDSVIDNDKNFTIKKIESTFSKNHPRIFLWRIKNDLMMSYSNCLEYIWQNTDSGGGWGSMEDISTTSSIDSNGNTTITLHSKNFQNLHNNRVVNALIIDGISKDGKEFKEDFLVLKNNAFADVKLKSLQSGKYIMTGKIRFYGYKGLRDYPFSHEFTIE